MSSGDTTMLKKNNGSGQQPLTEKDAAGGPRGGRAQHQPVERRLTFTPQVDIMELPGELELLIDMPGVKPENVEVDFERGELVVRGRREPTARTGAPLVEEFEVGDYYRAFLISHEVAADKITAELKHGVLTVRLPKAEAAQPRRITVKGS